MLRRASSHGAALESISLYKISIFYLEPPATLDEDAFKRAGGPQDARPSAGSTYPRKQLRILPKSAFEGASCTREAGRHGGVHFM